MQHSARPSPGIRATTLDEGDNLGSTIAVLWLNITFRSCNWRNSRRFEQRASIASALEEARDSLAKLGADVTVHSSPNVSVSAAIEQALVHLVREGATNIAKHATEHPSVTIQIEAIENDVRLELANSIAETPRNSRSVIRLRTRSAPRARLAAGRRPEHADGGRNLDTDSTPSSPLITGSRSYP